MDQQERQMHRSGDPHDIPVERKLPLWQVVLAAGGVVAATYFGQAEQGRALDRIEKGQANTIVEMREMSKGMQELTIKNVEANHKFSDMERRLTALEAGMRQQR